MSNKDESSLHIEVSAIIHCVNDGEFHNCDYNVTDWEQQQQKSVDYVSIIYYTEFTFSGQYEQCDWLQQAKSFQTDLNSSFIAALPTLKSDNPEVKIIAPAANSS